MVQHNHQVRWMCKWNFPYHVTAATLGEAFETFLEF